MNHRICMVAASLLGASGVGLGAFGAHGLRAQLLASGTTTAWETAVRYHQLHALALLALAVWLRVLTERSRVLAFAGVAWITGVVVFSGSLYWLALGGPRWLGPVTPFGGLALLAGWLALLIPAFTARSERSTPDLPNR